ncbi:N-acetylmannosamine-6-phosphate 2-epimerase [Oceanobacillus jordanicus]|uniref:Putative N-acetylmannosamine-6-phosphate 2-epimerase n=1 Tax=Oceanobacillus jordanicus TaxID=2867266 RepID=A0AAW5B1D3_9BACI|nr:N-acetylmannosamine-6-phosphate 2-epimerase [Oceanobacillus jordanicus]MCG3418291.1 N-acetylmannosamine-6-phosphate 2-epimerase [Oceanobacillus jordanicus]
MEELKGGLVVSCQALEHEPLHGNGHMAAMALAAKQGGAVGIRANGPSDIRQIKEKVDLPIIGIWKKDYEGFDAFITPTTEDAKSVAEAGADIIAVDATEQTRPQKLEELVEYIQHVLGKKVMADISTLSEGKNAHELGCDYISTTLSGYTSYTKDRAQPDFSLLEELIKEVSTPVVAEGNFGSPEQAKKALEIGAAFVVVGGAITRPQLITKSFVDGMKE